RAARACARARANRRILRAPPVPRRTRSPPLLCLASPEQCLRCRQRATRALERGHLLRYRHLEAERKIRGQRAEQPDEIEPAFAGEESIAARLADDLLHVGRPLRPRVAEL